MDIVVTVPKTFTYSSAPGKKGLAAWIAEGDPAGHPWSGTLWGFTCRGGGRPKIEPKERVYIVCENRLRGFAPLVYMIYESRTRAVEFVRGGDAVALTIPKPIRGFQGWRYRWWDYTDEVPFLEWDGGALERDTDLPSFGQETGPC